MGEQLKLITEKVQSIQLIESSENKDLYIEGIFATAELQNKNKRVYKKDTLQREVNKLEETIKNGSLWGELNHPTDDPDINLERAAILIEKLTWQGNNLLGRAVVLETPMGNIARALIKRGTVGISSRGLGSVDSDGYVNNQSYHLITWDVVGNPSNHPSWVNGIYEGKSWTSNEVFGEVVDNVAEEHNLTTTTAKDLYGKHILDMIHKIHENIKNNR